MDSETRNENKRIARLKGGTNYYIWRIYIRHLMHSLQSLFILTEPLPSEGSAAARKRSDDADRKARSAIFQNLGTQPIVAISKLLEREHCFVLEVWNKLESTYKKDNIQSRLNLRQKLSTLTLKDGDGIQKHLIELETTYLEFARIGDPLMKKDGTATLLRTLSESLMAITLLANATNMEYDQVISLARSEMDRRIHWASTSVTKITEAKKEGSHPYPAAKRSTTRRKQRTKENKKGVVCWNCGRIGHIKAECWRKTNNNQQQPSNKSSSNKYNEWKGRNNN